MREYLPILIVGAIVGVLSVIFLIAYVTMKDKTLEMDLSMEMVMGDMFSLKMYMNMDGTYQSTKLKPVTAPPTGAVVVDLTQMLAGLE